MHTSLWRSYKYVVAGKPKGNDEVQTQWLD